MLSTGQRRRFVEGAPRANCAVRSYEEVARLMTQAGYPMGRQRVRQIEHAAIYKLRKALANLEGEID